MVGLSFNDHGHALHSLREFFSDLYSTSLGFFLAEKGF